MDHVGIDVHQHASQICMIAEGGELIEQRVRTDASRLAEALVDRVRARILIEASTESEWVARCLLDDDPVAASWLIGHVPSWPALSQGEAGILGAPGRPPQAGAMASMFPMRSLLSSNL